MKKTAQQIQDNIFRKMSAEKKIKLVSSFWHSAKMISGVDRIYFNMDKIKEYIKKSLTIAISKNGQRNREL